MEIINIVCVMTGTHIFISKHFTTYIVELCNQHHCRENHYYYYYYYDDDTAN